MGVIKKDGPWGSAMAVKNDPKKNQKQDEIENHSYKDKNGKRKVESESSDGYGSEEDTKKARKEPKQ